MALPPHKDPNVAKWLKEQNAVATKYGYINSKTGELLTSDTSLPKPHQDLLPNVKPKGGAAPAPNHGQGTGGKKQEEEGQEATEVKYTLAKGNATVEATLTADNNDTGHEFTIGTLGVESGDFPASTKLALSDNSLSSYKIKLVKNTISEAGEVKAILQRARKDQNDAVNHEVTLTLKVGEKQQTFSEQFTIQISENSQE